MVTIDDLKTLKVPELKQELKDRGLAQTGRKEDLIKRLEEALSEPAQPEAVPVTATETLPKAEITNGRQPIEFKSKSSEDKLPAATGLEDPVEPLAEKPVEAKPLTGLTEQEKAKQRAERFGIVSAQDKLAARAKRFGVESKAAENGTKILAGAGQSTEEVAKQKERAKRFNLAEPLSQEEADKKKKARLDRFGKGKEKSTADAGELASKLAARAERFALSKPASQGTGKAAPAQTASEGATQEASKAPAPVSKRAQSIEEKNQAALAKAAAMVKPAANPEAEAKRQARAIKFQVA